MLKKQNRLGRIAKAKENKLFTSSIFNVRISRDKGNQTRFAFVVSKKIDKRAVVRNQTKRVLRSAVEAIIDRLKTGEDIVIFSKKALIPEQKKEVQDVMEAVFTKAGIINV